MAKNEPFFDSARDPEQALWENLYNCGVKETRFIEQNKEKWAEYGGCSAKTVRTRNG
jgi:hypothetical protein